MTPLYLITGFLGAGKTTFLREFTALFAGQRLAVLVNEFGAAGVDGKLLSDCAQVVSEIAGGSIFCTCKLDTFERELLAILDQGPEVVLVEASGLADPTSIWKLLKTRPCFASVEYRGCICLCDAVRFPKVAATARPCRKQLSVCDVLVLNKLDQATADQRSATLEAIRTQRPDVLVIETSFGKIPPESREALVQPKRTATEIVGSHVADLTLRSITLRLSEKLSSEACGKLLAMFAEDSYRIKGFVRLLDGCFLLNCVGAWVEVTPCDCTLVEGNQVVVLHTAPQHAREQLEEAMHWYPGMVTVL